MDLTERFWGYVARGEADECWLWLGASNSEGYGTFWNGERSARAHRVAYEYSVGPIPDGLVIDHLCRTPACCNPAHMEPVTHRENTLRGYGRTAEQARQTHCLRGHALDAENTRLYTYNGTTRRVCRTCRREDARRVRRERREGGS